MDSAILNGNANVPFTLGEIAFDGILATGNCYPEKSEPFFHLYCGRLQLLKLSHNLLNFTAKVAKVLQTVFNDVFDDLQIEFLVFVNGDVSQPDHLF